MRRLVEDAFGMEVMTMAEVVGGVVVEVVMWRRGEEMRGHEKNFARDLPLWEGIVPPKDESSNNTPSGSRRKQQTTSGKESQQGLERSRKARRGEDHLWRRPLR